MVQNNLRMYLDRLVEVFSGIQAEEYEVLVEVLQEAYDNSCTIFVFGNGGSGANASHFAADLNKGVSYGKDKRFKVVCLNDNVATMNAYANDVSYDDIFIEQLKNFFQKDDLVIGVSASGNSENVIKAVQYARNKGGKTFGICGYDGGRLKNAAEKSLVIPSSDMQKIEDIESIIFHAIMQQFLDE